MKLSVLIPAHNEARSLPETIRRIHTALSREKINHEILVINDHSRDHTERALKAAQEDIPSLVFYSNPGQRGYGRAVAWGLEKFTGDCVAIMMADLSDSPQDLVTFYRKLQEGYDCIFGDRFGRGGKVIQYPFLKWVLNRLANHVTRIAFGIPYSDFTNAFKLFRRSTIQGLKPFLSAHFNLTLEMPLKAVLRGYTYAVVPNQWTQRKRGKSKWKIQEMGSRYFFIFLYCLLEKWLSQGDYQKHRMVSWRK